MIVFSLIQYRYYYYNSSEGKTLRKISWDSYSYEPQSGIIEIDDDCEIIGSEVTRPGYYTYYYINTVRFKGISQLKKINDSAFRVNDENLTKFEFEKCPYLEEIGAYAFYNCQIKILNLSMCSSLKIIKDNAFKDSGIEMLSFPSSLSELREAAFIECNKLKEIEFPSDSNLVNISGEVFMKTKIISFYIPNHVVEINMSAFAECPFLKEVILDNANENFRMFDRCLYSSDYKRLIGVFPFVKVTTLHDSLEEIGEFSFYKSSIKSVIIPSSVKRIKRYAFFKSNIENVAFPEDSMLEIIEEYSFSYCLELFELNLSLLQNREAIQPYAFYATLLRKFAFPENDAFTEINPSFQGFVSIEIPSQIQFIYDNAFPVGYSSSSSSYYYSVLSEVKFKGNSELIYIGKYSFTSFISEIEIPNSTLKIDDYAFCNCPCLQYVIIPEDSSLTYIGYQAFGGCNLKEIFIPKYLNNISFGAFGFKHTLNIKISPLNKYFYADDNYLYSNRNQTIIQCLKIEMNSTIPLYVKELGSELFKNSILEEIFIPKNITVIHNSTFQYSSLKIVKFEEGSQLQEIPSMTFAYTKISNFFVPKFVSKIGDRAFYYSSIENISFENGSQLLEISDSAFEYCKITNILLPSALNYIGNNAFYQCNTLSNINFCERSQLRVIGNNSFAYNNISSILIPSSVQVINDSAFYQCNFWLVLHLRIIAT